LKADVQALVHPFLFGGLSNIVGRGLAPAAPTLAFAL